MIVYKLEGKYTESRQLFPDDLRALCIEKNWYTKGDSQQYGMLLYSLTVGDMTTAKIGIIAEDIKRHSETDEDIPSIMYDVAKICRTFFDYAEGENEE